MPVVSFSRFADELHQLYAPPLRAKSTYRQVRQVLRELGEVPVKKTSDLRPATIAVWLRLHPERSPVTWASHLRCLRALCQYGIVCSYIKQNPFDYRKVNSWVRVDVVAADRPRRQTHLACDQVRRILAQADLEAGEGSWQACRLQALVWTYAFTGLRAGEALNLRVADVDLVKGVLTVQPRSSWRPKTVGSARRIPLVEAASEVLGRWTPRTGCEWLFPGLKLRGPWVNGGPGVKALDHVRELGRRAGVEGATIIGFRKGIATQWKAWGGSPLARQKVLGHSSLRTAEEWYDEDDVEILRLVMRSINYG